MSRWDKAAVAFISAAAIMWGLFIAFVWWWPGSASEVVCTATLHGQVITASPGEWAVIDGYESYAVCTGSGSWIARPTGG